MGAENKRHVLMLGDSLLRQLYFMAVPALHGDFELWKKTVSKQPHFFVGDRNRPGDMAKWDRVLHRTGGCHEKSNKNTCVGVKADVCKYQNLNVRASPIPVKGGGSLIYFGLNRPSCPHYKKIWRDKRLMIRTPDVIVVNTNIWDCVYGSSWGKRYSLREELGQTVRELEELFPQAEKWVYTGVGHWTDQIACCELDNLRTWAELITPEWGWLDVFDITPRAKDKLAVKENKAKCFVDNLHSLYKPLAQASAVAIARLAQGSPSADWTPEGKVAELVARYEAHGCGSANDTVRRASHHSNRKFQVG